MPPDTSSLTLLGPGVAAIIVAVLLGRAIAGKSNRNSFSSLLDALAGLAGCLVVVISTGLTVGGASEVPSVLVKEGLWRSFLRYIWRHPEVMSMLGSAVGVVALRILRPLASIPRQWSRPVPGSPSRAAAFAVIHRREFHVIAAAGCLFTVLYAIDGFVSSTAPALWPFVVLAVGAIALRGCARKAASQNAADSRDWMSVPKPLRMILRSARVVVIIAEFGLALAVLSTVFGLLPSWLGKGFVPPGGLYLSTSFRVIAFGSIAMLYGQEALFFRYGDLRPPHD